MRPEYIVLFVLAIFLVTIFFSDSTTIKLVAEIVSITLAGYFGFINHSEKE